MKHSQFHHRTGIFFLFALSSGPYSGIVFLARHVCPKPCKINLSSGLRRRSISLIEQKPGLAFKACYAGLIAIVAHIVHLVYIGRFFPKGFWLDAIRVFPRCGT